MSVARVSAGPSGQPEKSAWVNFHTPSSSRATVARLEWAVSHAVHAPDAPVLTASSLDAIEPADHERVCFRPHPSVSLVGKHFPADVIWRAVLDNDDAALAAIDLASDPVWLIERNTFASTLIRALRLSYPAVDRLVGAAFFDGAARAFIDAHPPRSSYLDEFGGDFADFLAQFPPAASVPYLSDASTPDSLRCTFR
jgi:Putative DNA-binding domain